MSVLKTNNDNIVLVQNKAVWLKTPLKMPQLLTFMLFLSLLFPNRPSSYLIVEIRIKLAAMRYLWEKTNLLSEMPNTINLLDVQCNKLSHLDLLVVENRQIHIVSSPDDGRRWCAPDITFNLNIITYSSCHVIHF